VGSSNVQGELWGGAARAWTELQEPMHEPLWRAMLDRTNVGPGSRLLDIGCGGGGAGVLAAGRGARVSGLDAAAPLIEIAKERVPDGDFRVGDMEELPYEDESFDAVIAANSLQFAGDQLGALGELRRVCAEEGRVAIGIWGSPDDAEFRVVFKAIRDSLPEPPNGGGPFALSGPGVLKGLIEKAGMAVYQEGEADCPFEYANFDAFWRANTSAGPVQGALRSVSEVTLKEAVHRAIEPFQAGDGSIRMVNRFRYVVAGRNGQNV
jgi:SAM-dependent methyltransferase